MKIRTKILGGFMIVVLIGVIIGVTGFITASMLSRTASDMHALQLENASISNVLNAHYLWRQNLTEAVLNGTRFTGSLDPATCALGQWYDSDEANGMTDPALLQMLDDLNAPHEYIHSEARIIMEYIAAGDTESAQQYLNEEILPKTQEVIGVLTNMQARYSVLTEEKDAETTAIENLVFILNTVLVAIAVAAGVFFAIFIANMVSKPLMPLTRFMDNASKTGELEITRADEELIGKYSLKKDELGLVIKGASAFILRMVEISKVLETVADGDLTVDITLLSEKDTMGLSLNKMIGNLNDMFGNINASSTQVSAGAGQVADGAQSLAAGATQQAASIEELSSSVSEINGMAKESTQNATSALEDVEHAGQFMGVCMEQMNQMLEAMRAIGEKSQNIAKTTKVIDDIAFQTNILALNAAVEAARAGQHGKGFAVVAEEVRNLAAKSAEAAHETSALIESSTQSVAEGNRIVKQVNESLQAVAEIAQKNAANIAQLQAVSAQQSEAIEQVNLGIDQIAQVVQQNSATAEESAAASQEMSGQSAMLESLIVQFKLKNAVPHRNLSLPDSTQKPDFKRADSKRAYGKY